VSAGHREGQRRHEVRRFPVKDVASGQGVIDSRPSGPRGQAGPAEKPRPSGERRASRPKAKAQAAGPKTGAGPNSRNKTFLNFI
jgi:hypothetical protein